MRSSHPPSQSDNEAPHGAVSKRSRAPLHPDIWKIAASLDARTKVALREALARAGFSRRASDIDALIAACKKVDEVRQGRLRYRVTPMPSLLERLRRQRMNAVRATARKLFRHGAAGGHSMTVNFATTAGDVDYSVTIGRNWDTYAGAYKGWAAKEDHHVLCVPADWRQRVLARGLAVLGGMMTLDAHVLEPVGGIRLFAATWASQGRGYDIHVHGGFIAVLDDEHYHAETAEMARRGVQRKAKLRRTYVENYESTAEAFAARYAQFTDVVTLQDARTTGSCEYGIRSWCERVGLDYEVGEAPLQAVLEAFCRFPQAEVRRAVIHAVRRIRHDQKAGPLSAA
ncbi:hypothetical protein OKW41_006261 [Paraburkholderia sp. UCT70]|uniref:hypothetical protein n=1 Tax=Paraburkholderia sp. UCT70 TaxID=2991068 RepID=UPI003D25F63D